MTKKEIIKKIENVRCELIHSAYLTGWEILHYKNMLIRLIKKIRFGQYTK